jgi:hypothetical protein
MNPDTDDLSNRLFRPLNMTDKEIDPNLNWYENNDYS